MVRETTLSCTGCGAETDRASDCRNLGQQLIRNYNIMLCTLELLRHLAHMGSSSNLIGLHYTLQCVQVNSANDHFLVCKVGGYTRLSFPY